MNTDVCMLLMLDIVSPCAGQLWPMTLDMDGKLMYQQYIRSAEGPAQQQAAEASGAAASTAPVPLLQREQLYGFSPSVWLGLGYASDDNARQRRVEVLQQQPGLVLFEHGSYVTGPLDLLEGALLTSTAQLTTAPFLSSTGTGAGAD
jgi:hypothetical protein